MHGCYNRSPFRDTLMVQNGWTSDGRRDMIEIPFRMAKDCMYDLKHTDVQCNGCRWSNETIQSTQ